MASCVNKNTKEFKDLAEQSNINPIILAAKVSLWQEENGLDNFPKISDIVKEDKSSKETLEILKASAKEMGIDFVSLEDYAKANPDINLKNVTGLSDLIKGVIAVAQGVEDVVVSQEIIHVATAILEQTNPRLITELISKIDRFKIYKQVLAVYSKKKEYQLANGKPNIRKIKK